MKEQKYIAKRGHCTTHQRPAACTRLSNKQRKRQCNVKRAGEKAKINEHEKGLVSSNRIEDIQYYPNRIR